MAKNFDKNPMADDEFKQRKMDSTPKKHGLTKFKKLDWTDEAQITEFMLEGLAEDDQDRLRMYIRTLVEDETLDLTNLEIKRIAVAMLALDKGDNWFFRKAEDDEFQELSIELQKFLAGKEQMVLDTIRKAKTNQKKSKSLFDQLSDEFKTFEIKAEGTVEGIEYVFETKKKKKPQMLQVVVTEDGDDDEQSETGKRTEKEKADDKEE